MAWLPTLRHKLFDLLAVCDFDQMLVPLGIGWHVDHILTHLAFDTLATSAQTMGQATGAVERYWTHQAQVGT